MDNEKNIKDLADASTWARDTIHAFPVDPEAEARVDELMRRRMAGWTTRPIQLKQEKL